MSIHYCYNELTESRWTLSLTLKQLDEAAAPRPSIRDAVEDGWIIDKVTF